MNDRRIQRLQEQIKARVAEVIMRELQDPKIGLVTITRAELDKEFTICTVSWSVLGDAKQKSRTQSALNRARGFVQRAIGETLHTRTIPRLEFQFDATIEGAVQMQEIIKELREERTSRTGEAPPQILPPPLPPKTLS
ncbi:ribosome-binding factor A [Planctomycetota bacterium]|jgi:ribosome-binding factor A|nr:30S ribosome-binding factor RbfA [Planctomycetota bacterium]MSR37741.1 30S ribosome-binding factor RbfA [Planctomycetota bacterium]GDY02447.1 ribosome-binding factor A [Planctomycetota bacterium]